MNVTVLPATPFPDQRPGTAGLRRRVSEFARPLYLEHFLQSVLDEAGWDPAAPLVLGGDGRYFNDEAIIRAIAVLAGNGHRHLVVGRAGLLSTPAASSLIRARSAAGGLLFTASHNPGGPAGDFGIKVNMANGGQASEALCERIYRRSRSLPALRIAELPPLSLASDGIQALAGLRLEVVDPVSDYSRQMQSLFDFDRIAALLRRPAFRLRFDAMHAVTGPYASEILERSLGAPGGSVLRAEPLPDFGGLHPDPTPANAAELMAASRGIAPVDFAAASDGDGDRNLILGAGCMVHPCDSVAVLAAHHATVPGYRHGLAGVARSLPTSRALDRVASHLGIPCHVTPTGWRFFCNLLDAGLIGLCGEESFGTSSDHTREKDGLWAVLFWLNLLAVEQRSVASILTEHWRRFGRLHYLREDWQIDSADAAEALLEALAGSARGPLPDIWHAAGVTAARQFVYLDPVDGSRSDAQGVELAFGHRARIVYRLSGTGTGGATLRIYLECEARGPAELLPSPASPLVELGSLAAALARVGYYTGLSAPTARV